MRRRPVTVGTERALHRFGSRLVEGDHDRGTTMARPEIVCYHEAGHVVAYLVNGILIDNVWILRR